MDLLSIFILWLRPAFWSRDMVYPALLPTIRADAHTSAASSPLNWRLRRFKWTRPFRRKTKSGFCACAITFQLASTSSDQADMWRVYPSTSRGNSNTIIQSSPCVRRICQICQSFKFPLTPRILVDERHVKIQSMRHIRGTIYWVGWGKILPTRLEMW